MYVRLRPITSDVEDHTKRPVMLHSDRTPTKPAAAAALTLEKKSWIIGAACSRMPMPAVTLQNRTVHSSQNCGVLIALSADTFALVTSDLAATFAGSKPAGRQPGAGTLTVNTPNIITMK